MILTEGWEETYQNILINIKDLKSIEFNGEYKYEDNQINISSINTSNSNSLTYKDSVINLNEATLKEKILSEKEYDCKTLNNETETDDIKKLKAE